MNNMQPVPDLDLYQVDTIIESVGSRADAIIPLLLAIQKEYNYLPEPALRRISEKTPISASQVMGVASFYTHFRLEPAGKHFVNVCTGTACHVKGAGRILQTLHSHLKLKPDQDTDRSGIFTVQKVACLGCCTLAPVVQIDDQTYGHLSASQVPDMLEDFLGRQAAAQPGITTFNNSHEAVTQGEIRIGLGSCCVAGGSNNVRLALEAALNANQLNLPIKQVGCVGMCHNTPLVEVNKPGEEAHFYANVTADAADNIVRSHFQSTKLKQRVLGSIRNVLQAPFATGKQDFLERYSIDIREGAVGDFLNRQVRIATQHSGLLNPLDFDEYENLGGFSALKDCLSNHAPETIITKITESGLRGRGGGGFPTGLKLATVRKQESHQKYIICNGDEGDPGAFMDRMLLESYPYRIIEGMVIAAYAVGASIGILYIRAEYPLAVERIRQALETCYKRGVLGNNIMDSGFDLELTIREGAGGFVCGEETALIQSIEGERGMPNIRPPYPAEQGLWNKPTSLNNVETFALIPWIIKEGPEKFRSLGTETSSGTKVFSLAGKIKNGGLIEVPMGITIRAIVEEIGGGVTEGRTFKAVQIGGPSGGCIPAELSDIAVDYESLTEVGAMMGSGGLLVMDDQDCMVDIARYFLSFTQDQSCGKCTYCRIGTKKMLEILEKICAGRGILKDLEILEKLAGDVKTGSICGLGKTAPNPVMTTLRYFREEYLAHIEGKCQAGKCLELIKYNIKQDCSGCTICAQNCPVLAIPSTPYQVHTIDQDLCIKCDTCLQVCPEDSVEII